MKKIGLYLAALLFAVFVWPARSRFSDLVGVELK